MFVNTKADLGPCPKVHDDNLRLEYPKSDKFEKLGFEREFLKFLSRLDEDNQRRIRKNLEKLKANEENGQKKEDLRKLRDEQEIARIDSEIKLHMAEAEKRMNSNTTIPPPIDESAIKVMEVCEVCGSMLIKNDAQCRVEEHLSGKMHMGFSKIKVTIDELRERIRKRDEENEKERQKLREEREKRYLLNVKGDAHMIETGRAIETGAEGRDRVREIAIAGVVAHAIDIAVTIAIDATGTETIATDDIVIEGVHHSRGQIARGAREDM
ncbi:hypothetical protein OESDEN_17146 [Oesophagostomum dentatum]|uniref:LUC7 protein n=1 Tax=Oesophagostomum dentatum TaxID=61180 RepID=A0A0B1SI42_OESDE|nr:hypothetical protein OESDEN_17146 [Oesophagostomum dentatum]